MKILAFFVVIIAIVAGMFFVADLPDGSVAPQKELSIVQTEIIEPSQSAILSKSVRSVGGGTIVAPVLPEGTQIVRLPDAIIKPDEKLSEPSGELFLETATRTYPRPLVLSANSFRSGDMIVRIEGFKALSAEAVCQSGEGSWPCGNYAKAALQRLIRSRTVICRSFKKEQKLQGETISEVNCKVGAYDLANWLVSQGWAQAGNGELGKLTELAKQEGKGQWRP